MQALLPFRTRADTRGDVCGAGGEGSVWRQRCARARGSGAVRAGTSSGGGRSPVRWVRGQYGPCSRGGRGLWRRGLAGWGVWRGRGGSLAPWCLCPGLDFTATALRSGGQGGAGGDVAGRRARTVEGGRRPHAGATPVPGRLSSGVRCPWVRRRVLGEARSLPRGDVGRRCWAAAVCGGGGRREQRVAAYTASGRDRGLARSLASERGTLTAGVRAALGRESVWGLGVARRSS